jgi:prepilin-type N-terminal cleavage/methylation domain-containing protein
MHPLQSSTPGPGARAGERAFGLVEVVVVLLVIGIVLTIAVRSLGSAQEEGAVAKGRTTARTLGEAIEQFKRDRGGRVPAQPGGSDWSSDWRSPVDVANGDRPYAKAGSLEALDGAALALETATGTVAPNGAGAAVRLRYVADDASGLYAVVVRSRDGGSWTPVCHVTNATGGSGAAFVASLGTATKC